MARLFGSEFHEHSNSWYYQKSVYKLAKTDIDFKKYLDEQGNVIMEFRTVKEKARYFPLNIKITYDLQNRSIINWKCFTCSQQVCRHFLSIIDFAYHNMTTEELMINAVQTYDSELLEYDEYWQQTVLNARIEVSDIYNNQNNKIRFYFTSYEPMKIRILALLASEAEMKEADIEQLTSARKQMQALSQAEIDLLRTLYEHKCSYSRKGMFFTIYKDRFRYFFNLMRNLPGKVYIRETGEPVEFSADNFRLNFTVFPDGEGEYICKVATATPLSAVYVGSTTWFFQRNKVAGMQLPFKEEVAQVMFTDGYKLQKEDLVYFSSVVARQLGLIKCYIDFDEEIMLPEVYHNFPRIAFYLRSENDSIIIRGELKYSDQVTIPMSVINFPVQLARYDQEGQETWFYIPPQVKFGIYQFFLKLPEADENRLESSSELVYSSQKSRDELKKAVFEYVDPSWEVILTDELKKEFIYKVNLQPVIKTRKSKDIRWFEYDIEYQYKDITFSHSELKKFFRTREKYLKVDDGRLLYFQNKEAFSEMENLIKRSRKGISESWRLSVYNLTYIYQLQTVNDGIQIKGDNYLNGMVNDILQRHTEKTEKPVQSLQPVMRSYQKSGFRWLKMLQHYGLSGILADDMGLGKTLQALSILADLPGNPVSLVVCPKTLLFNWAAEIEKFCPFLSYIIYEGTQKERRKLLKNVRVNVIMASYSIIPSDLEYFQKINFDYVILDEAQHIKNVSALRTRAIKQLNTANKLCLTGTPVENNTSEIWSLFDFLMPGYLPPQARFKEMYSDENNLKDRQKVRLMISPFILRRKKEQVLIELPDKQVQTLYCKLSPLQEKLYLQILEKVKKEYLSGPANLSGNFLHILAALTKMRQICDHPMLVNSDINDDLKYSGKLELLSELIRDAVDSGHKLLVFSQFVGMLQLLKKMLKKEKITFEYMDGSTRNRQKIIENFNNNNKIAVFLISFKTGGYGLNLTAADMVIITDPWWNPMGENQAIDRAHRIGQTQKVMVYKTITRGTIEEKILDLQQQKREMFDNLIESGQDVIKNMTAEQLRELLEFSGSENQEEEEPEI
ncbi:MAG: DEAD/DEAH box helicase [Candidatus Cloacimonetes bacterium]|nr:DEAD/DEAH box helicase [Candidatus Cloacimonadota bacterium]